MVTRLSLIEDDRVIGEAMRDALVGQGYDVAWFTSGLEASPTLESDPPDLVLLDAGLPDIDGFTLCRWLRETWPDLPIVLVTARDSDIDTVVGLDSGANDYITKPFSMNVLLARVRAHLRSVGPLDPGAAISLGRLHVEPAAHRATIDGAPVDLRKKEFELLVYLVRSVGRAVTREQLLSDVWDLHWDTATKTVDMHVLALRRKLGDAVELTTLRGVGYRLEPR